MSVPILIKSFMIGCSNVSSGKSSLFAYLNDEN